MIKTVSISTISFYQIFLSPALKNLLGVNAMCRFDETCSMFTKRMIKEKGAIKGLGLGFVRILKCNPITS
jgi:uncharacterized protein